MIRKTWNTLRHWKTPEVRNRPVLLKHSVKSIFEAYHWGDSKGKLHWPLIQSPLCMSITLFLMKILWSRVYRKPFTVCNGPRHFGQLIRLGLHDVQRQWPQLTEKRILSLKGNQQTGHFGFFFNSTLIFCCCWSTTFRSSSIICCFSSRLVASRSL